MQEYRVPIVAYFYADVEADSLNEAIKKALKRVDSAIKTSYDECFMYSAPDIDVLAEEFPEESKEWKEF